MIELINEYARQWAGFFGLAVLQNTVFLGMIFLALYVLRGASARVKYIVAAIGIVKLLVPPFLPMSAASTADNALSTVPQLASNLVFAAMPAGPASAPAASPQLDAAGWFFVAWIVAIAFYLFYVIFSTVRFSVGLRTATEIPSDPAIDDLDTYGVKVLRSDRIALPVTIGLFPRRIYVPESWECWSAECRKMALRHEMAHIKRRDGLFRVVEIVARAIYFFHPLVWLLSRRLDEYREMACDDASTGVERDSRLLYSKNLVEIAETVARDTLTCGSASALLRRRNELLNRVKYQMKEGVMRRVSKRTTAILLASLALLILPLSWYQSGATPEPSRIGSDKKTENAKTASELQKINVSITGADKIDVAGSGVGLESFGAAVDEMVKSDPDKYVINLICANDVPMGTVFDVQRGLQDRGLLKISYNSDLPDAMPLVLPSAHLAERIKEIPAEDIAIVSVKGAGSILYRGSKISPKNLPDEVGRTVKNNERIIISIEMDRDATYEDFVTVLRAVKDGNAQRILINNSAK